MIYFQCYFNLFFNVCGTTICKKSLILRFLSVIRSFRFSLPSSFKYFQNFYRCEDFGNLRVIFGILLMAVGSLSESSFFFSNLRGNWQSAFFGQTLQAFIFKSVSDCSTYLQIIFSMPVINSDLLLYSSRVIFIVLTFFCFIFIMRLRLYSTRLFYIAANNLDLFQNNFVWSKVFLLFHAVVKCFY